MSKVSVDPTIFKRMAIITYEWGEINKCIKHLDASGESLYLTSSKVEFGDLLVQIELLIDNLGLDKEEIMELGWDHLEERMHELIEQGENYFPQRFCGIEILDD